MYILTCTVNPKVSACTISIHIPFYFPFLSKHAYPCVSTDIPHLVSFLITSINVPHNPTGPPKNDPDHQLPASTPAVRTGDDLRQRPPRTGTQLGNTNIYRTYPNIMTIPLICSNVLNVSK